MKALCIVTLSFDDDYSSLVAIGMSIASKYPHNFVRLNRMTWFIAQDQGESNVGEVVSYHLGLKRYGGDKIWEAAIGRMKVNYPCAFVANTTQWYGRAHPDFWPKLHAVRDKRAAVEEAT